MYRIRHASRDQRKCRNRLAARPVTLALSLSYDTVGRKWRASELPTLHANAKYKSNMP